MVLYKGKHSFACQRLAENNFRFFCKDKQILKPLGYSISDKILKTELPLGRLPEQEVIIKELSYDDLIGKGFQIASKSVKGKYFHGQKAEYLIIRQNQFAKDVGEIPEAHKIQFDIVNNKLRLLGKNSSKNWITINPVIKKERKPKFSPRKYRENIDSYKDYIKGLMIDSGITFKEDLETIEIPEIPIMRAEGGRLLVCLKEKRDNPIICLAGMRRQGRSFLTHRIMDGIYHKWNKKEIIINDALRETPTWCLEWEQQRFIKELAGIGEISLPLPIVYLHPKTNTLKNLIYKDEVGFEFSLPFKEVMMDIENFFQSSEKGLPPKSASYLRNLIFDDDGKIKKRGLLYKKNYVQMKQLIDNEIDMKKMEGVKIALNNFLKNLYNQNMFDIANEIEPRWTVEFPEKTKQEMYPWNACIMADLVASLINSDIRKKTFFPQYLKFVLDDLFNKQADDEYYIKNKIELFMMIDEPQSLFNKPVIRETINEIARESGNVRIGMLYVPQNINQVPEDLKLVTDTIIAYRCKKEQADSLVKDFEGMIPSYKKKELTGSLKKFEAILFTTESYITYDLVDGTKSESDEPIRGTVICPNSAHKPPKEIGD